MKSLKRFTITILCLLAAIACYVYGVAAGGALALIFFLTLGVVFEITFWIRALRQASA